MTKKNEVYKCEICGNIIEVLHEGANALVCCGKPMTRLEANAGSGAPEKHIPVIEKKDGKIKVKIGSALHPMQEAHFIEWVEVITPTQKTTRLLTPNSEPIVEFCNCASEGETITVREYCNIHGLWQAQQ